MIPAKFAPLLFGLLLSGAMSLLVSGISTLRVHGLAGGFAAAWIGSWLMAWLFAFPAVLAFAPLTRKAVGYLVDPPRGG
jgi:hypothetical protein